LETRYRGDEVRPFSAVAYFFARTLYEKYHVPIGLINSSVGGTPIEAWISEEEVEGFFYYPGNYTEKQRHCLR
jgi:sialate O-acetylesterase